MTSIVLDSSVAIKWYLREVLSEKALVLKDLIEKERLPVGVPRIFFLETANVLWKKSLLTHELSPNNAKGIYSRILDTSFHIVQDDEILLKALDIALRHAISVYDGMYLASALRLNSIFVTADKAFVKHCSDPVLIKHICFLDDLK